MQKDFIVKKRRDNYFRLAELLKENVEIPFKSIPDGVRPLFLPVIVENKKTTHVALVKKGVEAINFLSQSHRDVQIKMFTEVAYLRNHILEPPIHQGLDDIHIDYIASIVKEVV